MNPQIENLDKLVDQLWEKVEQEAIEYRQNTLVPFCDKYRLNYGQGMGRFYFYDKEWYDSPYVCGLNCGSEFDTFLNLGKGSRLMKNSKFVSELREIVAVLDHEIIRDQYFGFCIRDYKC